MCICEKIRCIWNDLLCTLFSLLLHSLFVCTTECNNMFAFKEQTYKSVHHYSELRASCPTSWLEAFYLPYVALPLLDVFGQHFMWKLQGYRFLLFKKILHITWKLVSYTFLWTMSFYLFGRYLECIIISWLSLTTTVASIQQKVQSFNVL